MASCRKVYDLAKSKGLTPILGCEIYFRDDDCEILKAHGIKKDERGTLAHYRKYFHMCVHARDQQAYEALVKQLSIADDRGEQHGSERKPLFNWAQLEELGQYNITMTSGCLVGMVQRHLLGDDPRMDIATAYYERLRSIVKPGNFFVEVFPHKCSHNWDKAVYLTLEGGEKLRFYYDKKLMTEAGETTAVELARSVSKGKGPFKLLAVKNRHAWVEREPKLVLEANVVEGFVQNECTVFAPDGDIQVGANLFVMSLANHYGDKILISDDAHFATPDEKIVQDCKLGGKGGSWRFFGSYHRQSGDESFAYFSNTLGISEKQFEAWVDNAYEWADSFKGFEFKDVKSLPTKFYPQDSLGHLFALIEKHGRMDWNNPQMMARLQAEIELLHHNGTIDLIPYFFVGEEICSLYAENNSITGPGRGSAAGMLIAYLLGITHVDPLRYDLSMERFLTLDRVRAGTLPDIDQDLPERETLTDPENGYLGKRFGDHYAQVSTDTVLRLKSSIKDVCRAKRGFVLPEIEDICKRLPNPPQGVDDADWVFGYEADDGTIVKGVLDTEPALQEYVSKFPADWAIVRKMLGVVRQKSRHACLPAGELVFCVEEGRVFTQEIEKCDGMTVLTGQGASAPAKLLVQGIREVVEYTLENGKTLRATPDHRVLTTKGWMEIQQAFEEGVELADAILPTE